MLFKNAGLAEHWNLRVPDHQFSGGRTRPVVDPAGKRLPGDDQVIDVFLRLTFGFDSGNDRIFHHSVGQIPVLSRIIHYIIMD